MNTTATIQYRAANRWRGARSLLCALAMTILMATGPVCASGAETGGISKDEATRMEYQLKAGFLFNFAKFVQWPATNNASTNHFRIGILDDGSVFPVMAAALANTTVRTQIVQVERVTNLRDTKRMDILFIARSQERKLAAVLKQVDSAPVLTVGETPDFARDGGCINLIRHDQNIRFEINLHAAERSGLKVSSKLASMAKIVEPPEVEP